MGLSLALQYGLIGLAIGISAVSFAHKQWPAAVRQLRVACALPLLREGSSKSMQTLGRWIAPVPLATKKECGRCNSCS